MGATALTPETARAGASPSSLRTCTAPGCTAWTLGGTCIGHDPEHVIVYPRGRPFVVVGRDGGDALGRMLGP